MERKFLIGWAIVVLVGLLVTSITGSKFAILVAGSLAAGGVIAIGLGRKR